MMNAADCRTGVPGAAARGLSALLLALAALLWLPAQAVAAPCHGAMEAQAADADAAETHPAEAHAAMAASAPAHPPAVNAARAASVTTIAANFSADARAADDCCAGGDCGGCGCAVTALPATLSLPSAPAAEARFPTPRGLRPSLSLPELFRPPISA